MAWTCLHTSSGCSLLHWNVKQKQGVKTTADKMTDQLWFTKLTSFTPTFTPTVLHPWWPECVFTLLITVLKLTHWVTYFSHLFCVMWSFKNYNIKNPIFSKKNASFFQKKCNVCVTIATIMQKIATMHIVYRMGHDPYIINNK